MWLIPDCKRNWDCETLTQLLSFEFSGAFWRASPFHHLQCFCWVVQTVQEHADHRKRQLQLDHRGVYPQLWIELSQGSMKLLDMFAECWFSYKCSELQDNCTQFSWYSLYTSKCSELWCILGISIWKWVLAWKHEGNTEHTIGRE